MSDLVTFTTDKLGRIEARLGERLVGIINNNGSMGFCSFTDNFGPTVNANYKITLPIDGAPPFPRNAHSTLAARRQLLQWLCGWFLDAGPAFQHIADAIAEQALRETDSGELVSREATQSPRPDSVTILSSETEKQMKVAEKVMEDDHELLRKMAKL